MLFENLEGYQLIFFVIIFKGIKTYGHRFSGFSMCLMFRVDLLVVKYLSAQYKSDPKGGLHCFWFPNKTQTSLFYASKTRTIVENRLKMRKLCPCKVKGVKTQKNKPPNITKADSCTPKKFFICMLLLEFQDDQWVPGA